MGPAGGPKCGLPTGVARVTKTVPTNRPHSRAGSSHLRFPPVNATPQFFMEHAGRADRGRGPGRLDLRGAGSAPAGWTCCCWTRPAFPAQLCAGWITPAVFRDDCGSSRRLPAGPRPAADDRLPRRTDRRPEPGRPVGRPISFGIRRSEFDDYLLRRCGARLHLGEPLARSAAAATPGLSTSGSRRRCWWRPAGISAPSPGSGPHGRAPAAVRPAFYKIRRAGR